MIQHYIVKKGDTLWGIAAKHLGSPFEWPRLWRHNNRKDVVAITGRSIPNPDLIYPGQKLLLPIDTSLTLRTSNLRKSPSAVTSKESSLNKQLENIKTPISIRYNLDELKMSTMVYPNAIVEMKMSGNVLLTSNQSFPITYVTNKRSIETKISQQANHAFGKLISDIKVSFDEKTRAVKLGASLISSSNTPNVPTTAVGVEISSNSPVPKLKYEIRLPKLNGNIGEFSYVAANATIVLEITPTGSGGLRTDRIRHDPGSSTNWDKVAAVGLVTVGTAIIVGTLIEDFFSGGTGVADDPACFAAAGGLYARAGIAWQGASTVAQRLLIPAVTRFTISTVPAGTLQYAH